MTKYVKRFLIFLSFIGLAVLLLFRYPQIRECDSDTGVGTLVKDFVEQDSNPQPEQTPETKLQDDQSRVDEYIKVCKNATLEFDKIESLGNFLKDISDRPAIWIYIMRLDKR